jgi:hypothetical protein
MLMNISRKKEKREREKGRRGENSLVKGLEF